jgi:hypothetical protein
VAGGGPAVEHTSGEALEPPRGWRIPLMTGRPASLAFAVVGRIGGGTRRFIVKTVSGARIVNDDYSQAGEKFAPIHRARYQRRINSSSQRQQGMAFRRLSG